MLIVNNFDYRCILTNTQDSKLQYSTKVSDIFINALRHYGLSCLMYF